MKVVSFHRGHDSEMRLTVSIPLAHGDWEMRQITVDRKTVMALIEDGIRMIREDEAKMP